MANMGSKQDFQKKQTPEKEQEDQNKPKLFLDFNALMALSLVTQLGLTVGLPAVGGIWAGKWLDERLGTGILAVIGLLLGLTAGMVSAYRLIKRTLR